MKTEDNLIKKNAAEKAIRKFILNDHPCVMAQTVVKDNSLTVKTYPNMDREAAKKILIDVKNYIKEAALNSLEFQTFIAFFENENFETEKQFEDKLWQLLSTLHKLDKVPWDEDTSPDPSSSKFSFSLLGHSFYIVGMHPKSSRKARSSPKPMIVFNLHSQFELLREANRYQRVKKLIRKRDKAFQGSVNPMLEDFGKRSEARQYSGRAVSENWKCPFNHK